MLAFVLVLAYLIGAIPFAMFAGRLLLGVDIRRSGSGNSGAMNTLRTVGPVAGVIVGVLDCLKGVCTVVLGNLLLGPEAGALAGCAAVIGHCFSPYLLASAWQIRHDGWKYALRLTGGKGLSTGMGMLLAVAYPVALVATAVFVVTNVIQRRDVTWPSVVGTIAAVPAMWFVTRNGSLVVAAAVVALVITIKHLPDLREGFWVEEPVVNDG